MFDGDLPHMSRVTCDFFNDLIGKIVEGKKPLLETTIILEHDSFIQTVILPYFDLLITFF